MDPNTIPKQPIKPADNTLPTKSPSDTQSADANHATNLPRPGSGPAAAPPVAPAPEPATPAGEAATQASTDPSAADVQFDTGGDTDPGASNTGRDEPL